MQVVPQDYKYKAELEIFTLATASAIKAAQDLIDKNPGVWYPCGFARVVIKPARGRFISMLKDQNIGSTSIDGGYLITNPSKNPTQWMPAKYEGAVAFAKVLKANLPDLTFHVYERMD